MLLISDNSDAIWRLGSLMSREQKYTGIILKKQPYGEGDEIITFFTKENGKVRCLAKSVKKSLAKLQQKLQTLFLIEFVVTTSSSLPKIINVEIVTVFGNIRESLSAMNRVFVAVELLLKMTPDEQKNERLFFSFLEFIKFLDSNTEEKFQDLALEKFKISILELSGMAVDFFPELELSDQIFFSPALGGFSETQSHDSHKISKELFKLFLVLKKEGYDSLVQVKPTNVIFELQRLTIEFIEYYLERKLKSAKFLS